MDKRTIADLVHPEYSSDSVEWTKWRLAYSGGRDFIDYYLEKLSTRESNADFTARKNITYAPSFAKAAINDVKNAIFQRTADVIRDGGPLSYQKAVESLNGGVDLQGSSMNSYIGRFILPEMLTMKRVGVYVDMPPLSGPTIKDNLNKRPYLYFYRTENIRSWHYGNPNNPLELTSLLLQDTEFSMNLEYGLPTSTINRFRHLRKENNIVTVQFFNNAGEPDSDPIPLKLSRIPFVIFEIPESLLKDVADIQIALLNISSSDLSYIRQSNYPFYVEQFDLRMDPPNFKPADISTDGGESAAATSKKYELLVGAGQGRRYGKGLERPSFIHPSSEPLKASMEKQEQLKRDIRQLINLSVSNLEAKIASAASKEFDNQGLESGLSFIGLVLENCERQIAEIWAEYEGANPATVAYPKNYSLKTEDDRQAEAEGYAKLMSQIPSDTYKRRMAKKIALTMLGNKVSQEELVKVYQEIDDAPAIISDPDQIYQDHEIGIVDDATASKLRGYPEGVVEIARKERVQRLNEVAQSQVKAAQMSAARGLRDFGGETSSDEKKGKPKRGEAKGVKVLEDDE